MEFMNDLIPYFEKEIIPFLNPIEFILEKDKSLNSEFDKTLVNFVAALQQSQSPFLSLITTEENFN